MFFTYFVGNRKMFFTYFVGNRKMPPSPKRGIRKAQNPYFSVFHKIPHLIFFAKAEPVEKAQGETAPSCTLARQQNMERTRTCQAALHPFEKEQTLNTRWRN